jgi:hypothetical protein
MQLIKQNFPVILGWFLYVVSARVLYIVLFVGVVWLSKMAAFEPTSLLAILFGGIVYGIAEYIGFATSVRWIVLPLATGVSHPMDRSKHKFLIAEWLEFCFYLILFCSPLVAIRLLPEFLSISKEVADWIQFIWIPVVSLFIYRSIILSYIASVADKDSSKDGIEIMAS